MKKELGTSVKSRADKLQGQSKSALNRELPCIGSHLKRTGIQTIIYSLVQRHGLK